MPKKFSDYKIDNKSVPGVTTILRVIGKPELETWMRKVGFEEADKIKIEAASWGDKVHNALEDKLMHSIDSTDPAIKLIVDNYVIWAADKVEKIIALEEAVYNDELKYAGTCDQVALMKDGTLAILDFKTSNSVWPEYGLQLSAYRNCNRTHNNLFNPREITKSIIVHYNKKTKKWEEHVIEEDPGLFTVFRSALNIYRWKEHEESKRPFYYKKKPVA